MPQQHAFQATTQNQAFGQSAFGGPTQQVFGQGTFGASVQPSQSLNAFGQDTFGGLVQPNQAGLGLGAFGQDTFGAQQSLFGPSDAQQGSSGQSLFGAPSNQAQQSSFGAQQSLFGAPSNQAQQSAFGAPSNQAQQSSFGAQSLFGAPINQAQQSSFGAQQSLFGAPSNQAQQSSFGAQQSMFGAGNQQSMFGAGNQQSMFGVGNQQSMFGAGNQQSTFGAGNQQGMFGAGDQQTMFGAGTQQGLFGGPAKDPEVATFPELFEAKDTIYACTTDGNGVVYVGDASGNLYAKSARDLASRTTESKVTPRSNDDYIGVTSLKVCEQGRVVGTTANNLGFIWDVNQNKVVGLGEVGQALARHSSLNMVFAGSWNKYVKCRDLRTNKDVWKMDVPGKCHALDVLQDQRLYVAVNKASGSAVCVFDVRSPSQSLREVACASPVRSLSASSSRVVWGTDGGDVTQIGHASSSATNKTQNIRTAHSSRAVVNQVDWSPNDEKVFVATSHGVLWTVDKTFKFKQPKAFVSSAPLTAISTSCSQIVVCKSYNYYDGGQAMRQGTAYKHNQVLVYRKST